MLTRMLLVIALVLCGIVALTGAWPGSPAPLPQDADSAFTPQAIPLDAAVIGLGVDARQLLEKALAKLGEKEAAWLNTKIRQTMHDSRAGYSAEGFLQLGPNQCARLELEFLTAGTRSQLVIVSDGEILAHVQRLPGIQPTANVERLPAVTEETARAAALYAKGCGGPAALVRPIQQYLQNGTLQPGLLAGRPVIRVKGELDPVKFPAFANLKLSALIARVDLDAKTLWPHRIEWSGSSSRPLLSIEFGDPCVGIPLASEECVRLFSYHPDGSEHVKEIKRR